MYRVNTRKLSGKIVEKGTTKEAIADEIGIDKSTFYRRLRNNKLLITDVHKICEILELSISEMADIFLAE